MSHDYISYKRRRFPSSVIFHAVWLWLQFPLSLRLIEEVLFERGTPSTCVASGRLGAGTILSLPVSNVG
jgi:hypothetical protein